MEQRTAASERISNKVADLRGRLAQARQKVMSMEGTPMTSREESLCRFLGETVLEWEANHPEEFPHWNDGTPTPVPFDFPLSTEGLVEHVIPAMRREGFRFGFDDPQDGSASVACFYNQQSRTMYFGAESGFCLSVAVAAAKAKGWE